MCNCNPNLLNNQDDRFSNQVVVELPDNQHDKARRISQGLSDTVCVDPCILNEIQALWSVGIQTTGCCCGHNQLPPFVGVAEVSIQQMINLGYVQEHQDQERRDTFRLKTT